MARDRGRYLGVYLSQVETPEWQRLGIKAAAAWWGLKLSPDNNQAGVYPIYREPLSERSRVPLEEIQDALRELESHDWIRMEGRWVWLRNHLQFDPGFSTDNQNQLKGLLKLINGLPRIDLVGGFVSYYKDLGIIPAEYDWNPSETPSEGFGRGSSNKTRKNQDREEDKGLAKQIIDAYNRILECRIGYSTGNLDSALRAIGQGYTLDQTEAIFAAVRDKSTPSALWCALNNHSFEYLTRPPYRKQGQPMIGPLDKITNELASTKKPDIPADLPWEVAERKAKTPKAS